MGETYDPKAMENVKIYSWQEKPTALASRVLTQTVTDKPLLLLPAIVDKEEQKKLQNEVNDEAASDPPSEEEDNDWEKILKQETDQILEELAGDNQEDQEQQEPEDVDVEAPTAAAPPAGRSQRPEFEDVGSPRKIPRTRPSLPRFGPGLPSVLRAELRPDNDVHSEDEQWFADEFCSYSGEESNSEGDGEETRTSSKKISILPSTFFDEEEGMPIPYPATAPVRGTEESGVAAVGRPCVPCPT